MDIICYKYSRKYRKEIMMTDSGRITNIQSTTDSDGCVHWQLLPIFHIVCRIKKSSKETNWLCLYLYTETEHNICRLVDWKWYWIRYYDFMCNRIWRGEWLDVSFWGWFFFVSFWYSLNGHLMKLDFCCLLFRSHFVRWRILNMEFCVVWIKTGRCKSHKQMTECRNNICDDLTYSNDPNSIS